MDEIKIKALIDAADSAKTIQELKRALRDLKSAAVEVGESSEYFNDITRAAGEVGDRIGDLNAQVKNLGDDLFALRGVAQIGQGIAAGFSVAQGAIGLFGEQNDALEQSILKVQSAMAMLNGVMAVAELLQKESAAMLVTQNAIRGITVGLVGKETVAKAQLAVANGSATLTQRALNAAMTANPAGILIAAITALVSVYYLFSDSTEELKQKNDALNSSLEYSRKLLEYQENAAVREIENRKDLAESRGADAKEVARLEIEKLNTQEKYAKQRMAALKKELAKERADRTDAYWKGEDDLAKDINTRIEKKQEEFDKLEIQLTATAGLENEFALKREIVQNKLTLSEKKQGEERAKHNKKVLSKKLEQENKYLFDKRSLDDLMLKNEIMLQETILETWSETYDKKLVQSTVAQEKEVTAIYDSQKKLVEQMADEWAKSDFGVAAMKKAENQTKTNVEVMNDWVKSIQTAGTKAPQAAAIAAGSISKAITDSTTSTQTLVTAIQSKYAILRERLLAEELERQKKMFRESARVVLSTDEYRRFYDYVKAYSQQVGVADQSQFEAQKKRFEQRVAFANQEIAITIGNIDVQIKAMERQREIGRQIMADDKVSAEQRMQNVYDNEGAIEMIQGKMDNLQGEISKKIAQLSSEYTFMGNKVSLAFEPILNGNKEIIGGSFKVREEIKKDTKELMNFTNQLDLFMGILSGSVGIMDKNGEDVQGMTAKLYDSINAMKGFGGALDAVDKGSLNFQDSVDKNRKVLSDLFDVQREVNTKGISESKTANALLAATYKDKNDKIVGFEKDLNSRLGKELDDRVLLINAIIAESNKAPIGDPKKKTDLEIKALQENLAKIDEIRKKQFAIEPQDLAKQFGLDELVKYLPDEVNRLTNILTDRYNLAVEAETKFFEQSLFEQFKRYSKGEITFEQYNEKIEEMKLNHEENLLVIDTTYGQKGQEAFTDFLTKRVAYAEAKHKEEVEKTYTKVQKIVELEKMAADLVMQYLQQKYAKEDRMSQERFDKRIALIDEEQKAYEDSITERTAAEQQQLDIQDEFDLRRQQAEEERRREQNDIAEKAFEANKLNSIAQLTIEYGVGIAKAFSQFGWPAGLIPASFLAAQLALQSALVATQEFVPQYASGGLVTGPGGPKDDKINAKLSNGESVINAKSTKMYAPLLSAINQAGGGVPIPHLASGGIVMPPEANIQNVAVVNSSAVVSLDQSSIQAIGNAVSSQTISVKENTISNAQAKVAKVDSRTKF